MGVENYGRLEAARGLHSRVLDFLRALDFIVETAIAREVDLVLFCGDAFRGREPSPTLQCLFAERIKRIADAQIPVLLLVGNHDLPPLPGRRSALEIYPILDVPGVEVVSTAGLRRIETPSGLLQVACLPAQGSAFRVQSSEPARHSLLSCEASAKRDGDGGFSVQGSAEENAVARLVEEMAGQVEQDGPAILAGHVSIEGARVGTEGIMTVGREVMLPREALLHPEFCYVALGHVHRFQDLNPGGPPPLVYCGSPERVDFSEEQEAKGVVLVEIESQSRGLALSDLSRAKPREAEGSRVESQRPKRPGPKTPDSGLSTHYDFIPTPARKFLTIAVDLTAESSTVDVLEAIEKAQIDDAVVKVILRSREEMAVDEREIRRALGKAYFATPLVREIEKPAARLRAPGLARGWDEPLAALEEYLKTTRFSEERKARLRKAAEKLAGEL